MEAVKLIGTAVAMLIGLILTPIIAGACILATSDGGLVKDGVNTTPVQNISGLGAIINLVPYIYVFVIIGAGLLTMYKFYKD